MHGFACHQIGMDVGQVLIADPAEVLVGEHGIQVAPIARGTPWRIARRNASSDHFPIPVAPSGVMLVA
jgi:hypothetical protein